jgi:hypothetical protein
VSYCLFDPVFVAAHNYLFNTDLLPVCDLNLKPKTITTILDLQNLNKDFPGRLLCGLATFMENGLFFLF